MVENAAQSARGENICRHGIDLLQLKRGRSELRHHALNAFRVNICHDELRANFMQLLGKKIADMPASLNGYCFFRKILAVPAMLRGGLHGAKDAPRRLR